jgi:hypothetical protein
MEGMSGTIDVSAPGATASVEVYGLAPGAGDLMTMSGTTTDGVFTCSGATEFDVETGVATEVSVYLNCRRTPPLGGVRVNGKFNFCAQLSKVVVSPLQTSVGHDVDLSVAAWDEEGDDVDFLWAATGGLIAEPTAEGTRFTCTATGSYTIFVSVSDNAECIDEWSTSVTCVEGDGGAPACRTDAECSGLFPQPEPDCREPTECTGGVCVRGDFLPEGTPCLRGGKCRAPGMGCVIPSCITDEDCMEDNPPNECRTAWTCSPEYSEEYPYCKPGNPLPAGTPCDGGNGACAGDGQCRGENITKSAVVWVACKNSITVDRSFLPSLLTITPPAAWKADPTETDTWRIGGEAVFDKQFLDAAQGAIPGGIKEADLVDLKWTAQARAGATMDDVTLTNRPIPYSCTLDRNIGCDPAKDAASIPGKRPNSDCTPMGTFNPCGRFVDLPISDDCGPGGVCETVGALHQCETNGFCISDQLRIPLEEQEVEVTPHSAGAYFVLGWHEFPNRGAYPDGTYILPTAVFTEPTGPVSFRVNAAGLSIALECMLGGNNGWTLNGPRVVRDDLLLRYRIPEP